MKPDAIVVGAGIVGAACAEALARGGLQVLVIDDARPGATAAGMGHLVAMDGSAAELALSARSLQLWRNWSDALDTGCAYHACGTLWVGEGEPDMDEAAAKQQRYAAVGIDSELLGARELALLEPGLRPGLAGGLRVAGEAIVYAPRVVRWLLARAGIARLQASVTGVADGVVHLADGQDLEAAVVVLANGHHASTLLPALPLRAKKGHLAITDRYPGQVRHQLVELGYAHSAHQADGDSVAFNVQPRPTGQLLFGSSRQYDRADAAIDTGMLARMLARCLDFLPDLGALNVVRSWTGVRCATPDGLPLIGRLGAARSLWLALGHEGLGVTTAPATAELLAAQVLGHGSAIPAAPYACGRFGALA